MGDMVSNRDALTQDVRDKVRRELRAAERNLGRGNRHERAAGRLLAAATLMMDGFSGPARGFVAEAWEELGRLRDLVAHLGGKLTDRGPVADGESTSGD